MSSSLKLSLQPNKKSKEPKIRGHKTSRSFIDRLAYEDMTEMEDYAKVCHHDAQTPTDTPQTPTDRLNTDTHTPYTSSEHIPAPLTAATLHAHYT